MAKILIVDDELSIRESFNLILEDKYEVSTAASGEAALTLVADQKFDLAFLDVRMPGLNGLETLKRLKELDPALEVIMVTAVNEVQKANEAIKLGARDYLVKPFDVSHVLKLAEQLLRRKAIIAESSRLSAAEAEVISRSERSNELIDSFEKMDDNEPVLLIGETGTEKELMARLIHEKSRRADQPFLVVNLAEYLTEGQIKTILFGLGKSSNTIEITARTGMIEQASGGTLFINNIEALPPNIAAQIKLGRFSREGSDRGIKISTRLIGACHTPPTYDFAKVVINLPSLRSRPGEIPLQIKHYLEKYNNLHDKSVVFSPTALDLLSKYAWPGNTQELGALVESLVLSSGSFEIRADDLPFNILLASASGSNLLERFEQKHIKRILNSVDGDQEKAAQLLGIQQNVLASRI